MALEAEAAGEQGAQVGRAAEDFEDPVAEAAAKVVVVVLAGDLLAAPRAGPPT